MDDSFRSTPGTMGGWGSKKTGERVSSFITDCEEQATQSASLKWYVDPNKDTPVWIQLTVLWIKKNLLRMQLN